MTDDETTHASILAAAITVVADVGYTSAPLSAIAAGAGVPEAVIEHQFQSKAMLMSEAAAWIFGDLAHYIASRIEPEPAGLPRIQMYIRAMCNYYYENPRHLRALGAVLGSGELVGAAGHRTSTRRWQAVAEILGDGQREGRLGTFDPKAVAIVIGGGIDGLLTEWASDPSFDLPAAAEELAGVMASLTQGAVFAP